MSTNFKLIKWHKLAALTIAVAHMAHSAAVLALPSGYQVEAGEVTFEQTDENTLVIHASDRAIIGFDSFSIDAGQSVRFVQPLDGSVLGRVTGGGISSIFGSLYADAQFILVNPAGIHFHEGSSVQAGSFVASTLDIQNAMYLDGTLAFEKLPGSVLGEIVNEGELRVANGGYIALLGERIANRGLIEATLGSVLIGSGTKQTISFDGGLVNLAVERGVDGAATPGIENLGTVRADGGKVVLSARALDSTLDLLINNDGVVEASVAVEREGRIEFVSNGAIQNSSAGKLRSSIFDERGYTFRNFGLIDGGVDALGRTAVGNAFYDNLDGAADISGNIGSNQTDVGDIRLIGNVTLTANDLIFTADSNGDGVGLINMQTFQIDGGAGNNFNLRLVAGQNSTLNTFVNMGNLDIRGAANGQNPTYTASSALSIGGTLTVGVPAAGAAPAATLAMGANALTTGGLTINNGAISGTGAWDVNGALSLTSGTNGATMTATSGNLNVSGDFTIGAAATTFTHNSGTVIFDGSGTQSFNSGGEVFNNVTHSGSGTLQLTGALTGVVGSISNSAGIFNLNGSNLGFDAARAVSNTATIRLIGSEAFTNVSHLDIDSGTVEYIGNGDALGDSYTLKDFGGTDYNNLLINFTDTLDTAQLFGNQSIAGTLTVTRGSYYASLSQTTVAGLTTVNGGDYTGGMSQLQQFNGGLTVSSGTIGAGVAGMNVIDVNGDVNMSGGTWTLTDGANTTVSGNFTKTAGTLTAGTSVVVFDGTGTQAFNSGGSSFYSITHSGSGTLQLTGALTGVAGNISNTAGILNLNGSNLGFDAARAVSNTSTIRLMGSEAFTNVSHLDIDSGTVEYIGNGDAVGDSYTLKDFGGTDYFNLTLNSTTAGVNADTFASTAGKAVAGAFTVTSGVYSPSIQTTTVTGLTTINGGTYLEGSFAQTFNGGLTMSSGSFASNGTGAVTVVGNLEQSGGTFEVDTLAINSGNLNRTGGTWTNGLGSVTFGGSGSRTIRSGGASFIDVSFSGDAGSSWQMLDAMDVDDDLLISANNTLDSNAFNHTIGGDWSNSGTFTASTGTVAFDGTAGQMITTGGVAAGKQFNNFSKTGSGTSTLGGALQVNGTFIASDGTFTTNANAMTVTGLTTVSGGTINHNMPSTQTYNGGVTVSSGVFTSNAATVNITGTFSQTNGTFNASSGTTTLNGDFTRSGGAFSANGGTFIIGGSTSMTSGGATFNNLTVGTNAASGSLTLQDSLDIDGTLAFNTTGGTAVLDSTNRTVNYAGATLNLTNADTFTSTGSTWIFDGTTSLTSATKSFNNVTVGTNAASGSLTLGDTTDINGSLTFNTTGGTAALDSTNRTVNYAGATLDLTNADTFTTTGSTWIFDGTTTLTSALETFNNVTIGTNTASGSLTLSDTADINGSLTFSTAGGTTTLNLAGNTLAYAGASVDFTNLDTFTVAAAGSTFTLDGTTDQSVTTAGKTFNNFTVNNAGVAGNDDITVAGALDIDGSFTLTNGNFTAPAAGTAFTVGDDFTVGAAATFTHNSGTVTFDTVTDATLDAPAGGLTFWDFVSTTPGKTLRFTSGDTFNINSPSTWTVTGALGNLITLTSTGAGQWTVNAANPNVSFVNVSNSNNTGATVINPAGSFDGGGNTRWFPGAGGGVSDSPPPVDEILRIESGDDGGGPGEDGGGMDEDPGGGPEPVDDKTGGNPGDTGQDGGGNETTVYVTEGAVDVDNIMVYDGESVTVQKGLPPQLRMRAIYVATGEGLQVFRGRVHTLLKNFSWNETPASLASSAKGGGAFAVLPKNRSLVGVETDKLRRVNLASVEEGASGIAISADERYAYVCDSLGDKIEAYDLKKGSRVASFETGAMPSEAALSKDGKYLFVLNRLEKTVMKIDVKTGRAAFTARAGERPAGLALAGGRLCVADSAADRVLVFSAADGKPEHSIPVGKVPFAVTADAGGTRLFVANRLEDTVSVVDLVAGRETAKIAVGQRPSALAVLPEGDKLYVSNQLSGTLSVVKLDSNDVVATIPTASSPGRIAIAAPEPPLQRA